MKSTKRMISVLCAALFAGCVLSGCGKSADAPKPTAEQAQSEQQLRKMKQGD